MYVAITDNPLALFFTNFSFDFYNAPSIFLHGINNIYDINNPAKNGFSILKNVPNLSVTFEKLSNILYTITTVSAINNHDILFLHPCFISSI